MSLKPWLRRALWIPGEQRVQHLEKSKGYASESVPKRAWDFQKRKKEIRKRKIRGSMRTSVPLLHNAQDHGEKEKATPDLDSASFVSVTGRVDTD
ncbi:hypothetical protein ACRRTK_003752 [Alexandromys fortis]